MSRIDLKTLATAIKRSESEIAMFPETEFPVEHRQARALVEAGKAYRRWLWPVRIGALVWIATIIVEVLS